MSRSEPAKNQQEKQRYYIGYDVEPLQLQKQSKYSPDVLSLPKILAEVEDADYKYNNWDLDEPEQY